MLRASISSEWYSKLDSSEQSPVSRGQNNSQNSQITELSTTGLDWTDWLINEECLLSLSDWGILMSQQARGLRGTESKFLWELLKFVGVLGKFVEFFENSLSFSEINSFKKLQKYFSRIIISKCVFLIFLESTLKHKKKTYSSLFYQ